MLFYEFKSGSDFITQLSVWRSLLIEKRCCLIPCNQSIHFTLLSTWWLYLNPIKQVLLSEWKANKVTNAQVDESYCDCCLTLGLVSNPLAKHFKVVSRPRPFPLLLPLCRTACVWAQHLQQFFIYLEAWAEHQRNDKLTERWGIFQFSTIVKKISLSNSAHAPTQTNKIVGVRD